MGQGQGPGNHLADQPSGFRPHDHISHLQRPLADRAVFQGPQTESESENLRRHHRKCAVYTDLDSIDRHVVNQIPQLQGQIRLVAVEPGGFSSLEPVYLSGFMGMDRPSF